MKSLLFAIALLLQTAINPNQINFGSVYTGPSAALAVAFCAGKTACEWHINGPAPIAASQTLPANIGLVFNGGGQLVVVSGAVLTINGSVVAPQGVQIFAGAGSVVGISVVDPAWYPAGYTLAQIIAGIPDTPSATVLPWVGSIRSGTENGTPITRNFLAILGHGRPTYLADHSAFAAGYSIVQGQLTLSIPNFTSVNVGYDNGSYQAAHGGWCGADPSGNNATGNLVNIKLPGGNKSNIVLKGTRTLGCTASTPGHSMLIEGWDGLTLADTETYYNTRGVVIKSSNLQMSDTVSMEHFGECGIFKADGTNGGVAIVNIQDSHHSCVNAPGETDFFDIFGDDAALANLQLTDLSMTNSGYLDINGYTISHGGSVSGLELTNFHSAGSSATGIQTVGGIGTVTINGGYISGAVNDGVFLNAGNVLVSNLTVGPLGGAAYGIHNKGAVLLVMGGTGLNLANAYLHGESGVTRYVGSIENGNAGIIADGNAVLNVPTPYDTWGAGNLTAPYGAQNYFAKFNGSDSRYDHASSVTGFGTAQHVMYALNAAANQKRSMLYADAAGVTHLAFMDDVLNSATGLDVFSIPRNGYTPLSFDVHTPITAPSVTPANGFTGVKTVGSCTLTIISGIITAVTGC